MQEVHMSTHSCVIAPHLKGPLSRVEEGKYGSMFPDRPGLATDEEYLLALGRSGSMMDVLSRQDDQDAKADNPRIPAAFPFLGQFIAHDITADRSLLQHHARLNELRNFRAPRLDLECLYASGPVGDPRNDVHLIISQLHLAFLKFHNRVVDYLRGQGAPAAGAFKEAQRLVRWHYQWIVVHEFLPLTVGETLVDDLLANGPQFYAYEDSSFIPVEFADAAYRFGHSQVRTLYTLNAGGAKGGIFPECAGTCPVPHDRVIDWRYFFRVDDNFLPQPSKKIDTSLAHSLIDLPQSVVGETEIPEQHSLAYRDLERGLALDLPSGEAVSRAMDVEPLTGDEVGLAKTGYHGETPLFYYILKEGEVRTGGERLGDVGGRIVAEVLLGLIDGDPTSYRNAESEWRPTLPGDQQGHFTMADLLRFARAV